MDGRDGTPDCRVGRRPAPGSLRMGSGTNIPAARSRSGLWSGFHPGHPRHGYSRSTNFAAVAMAKCLCRTADRLDPTGMRRSYRGLRRAAPSSRVAIVHEPLQRSANTSVVRQRCSGITCSSCRRPDSSEADSRRSPPPVRPDLICGRDRHQQRIRDVRDTAIRLLNAAMQSARLPADLINHLRTRSSAGRARCRFTRVGRAEASGDSAMFGCTLPPLEN